MCIWRRVDKMFPFIHWFKFSILTQVLLNKWNIDRGNKNAYERYVAPGHGEWGHIGGKCSLCLDKTLHNSNRLWLLIFQLELLFTISLLYFLKFIHLFGYPAASVYNKLTVQCWIHTWALVCYADVLWEEVSISKEFHSGFRRILNVFWKIFCHHCLCNALNSFTVRRQLRTTALNSGSCHIHVPGDTCRLETCSHVVPQQLPFIVIAAKNNAAGYIFTTGVEFLKI